MNVVDSKYYLQPNPPIDFLDCKNAFENLTESEKIYAHNLCEASWIGAPICLLQCSPESPPLFFTILKLFTKYSPSEFREKCLDEPLNISTEQLESFILYLATFLDNMGNYKSFGDIKFLPSIDRDLFLKIIRYFFSDPESADDRSILKLWENFVLDRIYHSSDDQLHLGFWPNALTTYFGENCDLKEAELSKDFMSKVDLSGYNTRLFKKDEKLIIKQASSTSDQLDISHSDFPSVIVQRGDYSNLMQNYAIAVKLCADVALNETQRKMLNCYKESFLTGDINSHKDGSRFWVQDIAPAVETYMGFIESYRDPQGIRGEFESFVAMVDRETSKIFENLVSNSEEFLTMLPWPKDFEKDQFLKPDFTALQVLTFASSGIPVGINIPNYNDIRQNEGFKNVSLQNVLTSRFQEPNMSHIDPSLKDIYKNYVYQAFDIQVGLHELLGHGSGKLFCQDIDGNFNFDVKNTMNFETNKPIDSWYKHGETWMSVFTSYSSAYEECRAECVGLYLCTIPKIQSIFNIKNHESGIDNDVVLANWLYELRAGLVGLDVYNKESKNWGQAHCHARFVILRVILEAGNDFVKIKEFINEDGAPDICIQIDRTKLGTIGRPALGKFLSKLQLYKSTANFTEAKKMFDHYSAVDETFIKYKEIIFKRRKPRSIVIQGNTFIENHENGVSTVVYRMYPTTMDGMLQSFVDRYSNKLHILDALMADWKTSQMYLSPGIEVPY